MLGGGDQGTGCDWRKIGGRDAGDGGGETGVGLTMMFLEWETCLSRMR